MSFIARFFNLSNAIRRYSKKPWVSYEMQPGLEPGLVKIEMNWNPAFTKFLHSRGFTAINEEENVQMFLFSVLMPKNKQDGAVSEAHPKLSEDTNIIKYGDTSTGDDF